MERKVGERFTYKGVTLEVKDIGPVEYCIGCYFRGIEDCRNSRVRNVTGPCGSYIRKDSTGVIFKNIEEQ